MAALLDRGEAGLEFEVEMVHTRREVRRATAAKTAVKTAVGT